MNLFANRSISRGLVTFIRYAASIALLVHGFFVKGMPPMFGQAGETIDEMPVVSVR
jgi:hypothetical protein